MWAKVLVNAALILLISGEQADIINVVLDASRVVGPLQHFWESTGFCPPDPHQDFRNFIFTNDELQNLAYIGSVPNKGIKQVRIHWLLDLVSMELDVDRLVYNFTYLDKAISLLVANDLKPGFELMGNPSNFFSDFDDTVQIYAWRDLIASLAKHLIEIFGLEEVSQWNFESWNEPQNKRHFDGLHVSVKGYLMYYDACSEGLKMAHPSLRLGGPATGYPDSHPIFWSLLQHCNNGTNFFTGERGVRLDFISFHIKGDEHSLTILNNETVVLEEIARLVPKYKTSPIYNDEGDPLVGWSLGEEWRADATYAAIVVKILAQHQEMFVKTNFSVRYNLLSNDNGFISYPPYYFRQRTLLARFQMNHSNPRKVEFVKKPILSVMGLLALLGDEQIKTSITFENGDHDDFGVMATIIEPHGSSSSNDWELAALLYNSNDTSGRTSLSLINISVVNIPSRQDVAFVVYRLDNENGNPFGLWKEMGSPVFPSDEQLSELRLHQEPVRCLDPSILSSDSLSLSLSVPLPGIGLLHVCAKPMSPPQKVEGVRVIRVSSYEVLVTWRDVQSRCLLSYQVLYSVKSSHGPFKRVNKVDIIFTSFHHLLSQEDRNYVEGWYSIVAVDYWGRHSPSSLPVTINWTSLSHDAKDDKTLNFA